MEYAARSVGNAAEEDAAGGLLPQTVAGLVEKLVARVSERGYITHDELRAARQGYLRRLPSGVRFSSRRLVWDYRRGTR